METSDYVLLLAAIRGGLAEIVEQVGLAMKMSRENRVKFTPDEKAKVLSDRAEARQMLVDSIEREDAREAAAAPKGDVGTG